MESFFKNNKELFTDIYLKNRWGDKYSLSGPGSNLSQTRVIVEQFPNLINTFKIKNILDIPCGDFFWMKDIDFNNLNYIGADIVTELINDNLKRFRKPNIDFQIIDILSDDLPTSDLVFCRDCLVHYPFKDIYDALKNIKKSNSKYFMTTNFTERNQNMDISTGYWRPINFCKDPFNFPESSFTICEKCTEGNNRFSDKSLSLWEVKNIPDYE